MTARVTCESETTSLVRAKAFRPKSGKIDEPCCVAVVAVGSSSSSYRKQPRCRHAGSLAAKPRIGIVVAEVAAEAAILVDYNQAIDMKEEGAAR